MNIPAIRHISCERTRHTELANQPNFSHQSLIRLHTLTLCNLPFWDRSVNHGVTALIFSSLWFLAFSVNCMLACLFFFRQGASWNLTSFSQIDGARPRHWRLPLPDPRHQHKARTQMSPKGNTLPSTSRSSRRCGTAYRDEGYPTAPTTAFVSDISASLSIVGLESGYAGWISSDPNLPYFLSLHTLHQFTILRLRRYWYIWYVSKILQSHCEYCSLL